MWAWVGEHKNAIILPLLVTGITIGLGYFFDIFQKIPALFVPQGAVVAFKLRDCPRGWSVYDEAKGKVILGAGNGKDARNRNLTYRPLEGMGGEETVVLEIDEMPNHSHFSPATDDPNHGVAGLRPMSGSIKLNNRETTKVGGGEGHENMPPWIALTYCIRN